MTLSDKQWEFLKAQAKLILFADSAGLKLTQGDGHCHPCPQCGWFNHKRDGFHPLGLAQDFNLFKGNTWLKNTEDHLVLAPQWVHLGGTWGGNFSIPDGNHYSWGEVR